MCKKAGFGDNRIHEHLEPIRRFGELRVTPDPEHPHWEYETCRPPRDETRKEAKDPKRELNEIGARGWEFVGTIEYEGGGTKYLVFKRPAREE